MRRRFALSGATFVILAGSIASTARPVAAQGVFDAIKKKADEAKKAADAVKRKADSTAAAAAKAKAAADSAKTAAENARTSLEGAAREVTSAGSVAAPTAAGAARNGRPPIPPPTPASAAGSRPNRGTAAAPSPAGPQALSRTAAHVEAQVLLEAEPGTVFNISPRGQHVAGRIMKGSRSAVVHDGVAGPGFEEIPGAAGEMGNGGVFSDDGSHHAYVARQGKQWVVMEDGKEVGRGEPFFQNSGNQTVTSIGFTPGGKHLYFTVFDGDHSKFQFYFDGKPDPTLREYMRPVFSPDGEHYAYVFQVAIETGNPLPALMVDGTRAAYAGGSPQFTADGHLYTTMVVPNTSAIDVLLDGRPVMRVPGVALHMAPSGSAMLASVVAIGPKGEHSVFLTIGNKRVPNSDCHGSAGIDGVYFSADAKHWAIRCQDSYTSYWVMSDGKKGQDYQRVASDVSFTTDGRPVYMAVANGKSFIIVGDQEFGPYAVVQPQAPPGKNNLVGVPPVPFVITGNHVGFIAMESNTSGLNRLVVVDGKVTKGMSSSDLTFSPDGSHFAYVDGYPDRAVMLDGLHRFAAPFIHETSDVPAPFVFSQDSKHIAFGSASQSGAAGRAVAIDDGMFATDAVSHFDLTFTPDGRHLIWLGSGAGGHWRVYVDGQPVLDFDGPATTNTTAEAWWSMGAEGVLTFIGRDAGAVKRYRITPGNGSIDARLKGG